jgi:two-component system chemotaxis response regulator CheB
MAAAAPHPDDQQPLRRDVVVVGASAGGVEALARLVASLPADFPAAVLVVLHVLPGGRSVLGEILARAGRLPAATATDGARIERGRIYVAPPDHHLLLDGETLRLSRGPRENGHRPAIDLLFRSAAESRGPRLLGVVLTGLLDDGAAGLRVVKERGGAAVVQAPDDALYPAMPLSAIAATDVDAVVPIDQMAATIGRLLAGTAAAFGPEGEPGIVAASGGRSNVAEALAVEAAPAAVVEGAPEAAVEGAPVAAVEAAPALVADPHGTLTGLTCPECGGALRETRDGALQRFNCNVGHSYSVESMLSEQGRALESTLSGALRALEERAALLRRLALRSSGITRRRFEQRSRQTQEHANDLRETLLAADHAPAGGPDGGADSPS